MSTSQSTLSREQFGARARDYIASKPHAQGESLERLVALTRPQADWRVLDVATGAGHTAYAFAPHVARVWATDITDEMLAIVREQAAARGLANVRAAYARAEALPFEDQSFDLVTSRIAPHHFDSIPMFLKEARRVLKRGGTLAIVDNVVPEGSVGDYVNAFERFRDPSHLRAWTMEEWHAALAAETFSVTHTEELPKTMDFTNWATRHDATMQAFLRSMLIEATPAVQEALAPELKDARWTFRLREGLFVAQLA